MTEVPSQVPPPPRCRRPRPPNNLSRSHPTHRSPTPRVPRRRVRPGSPTRPPRPSRLPHRTRRSRIPRHRTCPAPLSTGSSSGASRSRLLQRREPKLVAYVVPARHARRGRAAGDPHPELAVGSAGGCWRGAGLCIQARPIARGLACPPVPQAMFSANAQARAAQIAGAADAVHEAGAVERGVIEVVALGHVACVAAGRAREARIETESAQAVPGALSVQHAQRRPDQCAC